MTYRSLSDSTSGVMLMRCDHIMLDSPKFLRAKAATAFSSAFSTSWPSQFCPSVRRLSVCPSHGWISQKRCKIGSPNLHRRLPGRL